jgi:hypothetical protein
MSIIGEDMSEDTEELVAGSFYKNLTVDERVNSDLRHCLYCYVNSRRKDGTMVKTDFKISLDSIGGDSIKQCPACKVVYILGEL